MPPKQYIGLCAISKSRYVLADGHHIPCTWQVIPLFKVTQFIWFKQYALLRRIDSGTWLIIWSAPVGPGHWSTSCIPGIGSGNMISCSSNKVGLHGSNPYLSSEVSISYIEWKEECLITTCQPTLHSKCLLHYKVKLGWSMPYLYYRIYIPGKLFTTFRQVWCINIELNCLIIKMPYPITLPKASCFINVSKLDPIITMLH